MVKYIFLLFFINTASIHSQNIYTGTILTYEDKGIPNAKIVLKSIEYETYSDVYGKFTVKGIKAIDDTLVITALGYYDVIITNFSSDLPTKIYLEKDNSETLDELIITTYNSKEQHWINFFGNKTGKFRNKYYRNKYYNIQTLFKGSANINQFTVTDTLRIKGFSVYTINNIKQNIALRPIILKNELDINNNLVKDIIKTFSIGKERKGKIISLEFSFENVITFYPGEQMYLGVELINSSYLYPDGKNYLQIICYNKESIPISSFRRKILTEMYSENLNTPTTYYYERPFYFELKILK